MRSKGFSSIALVLLIAGVWLLGSPTDALAQKQRSPLQADEGCAGPKAGKAFIKDLDNGDTMVKVKFTSGPKRITFDVFWLCTDVSGGCHDDTCDLAPQIPYIYLGSFKTDRTGKGVFKTILPGGNPFPGKFVHLDVYAVEVPGAFVSKFGAIPAGAVAAVAEDGAVAGDPVQ